MNVKMEQISKCALIALRSSDKRYVDGLHRWRLTVELSGARTEA